MYEPLHLDDSATENEIRKVQDLIIKQSSGLLILPISFGRGINFTFG